MKYFIAIPTYNGGEIWKSAVINIKKYVPQDCFVQVIDSSSQDDTVAIAINAGFDVLTIASVDFNHGGTRNLAVEKNITQYDIVIFLTQDAIPQEGFIDGIISAFQDDRVVCAYGRQLPHEDANPLAQHARSFSYPEKSYVRGKENIPEMGLKTVFMSNSFSAYRLSVFNDLGGFPSNTILCEDMFYTAKAVLAGYKVAYVADAIVRHSHNYSPVEEFKRYFDIGVFHSDEPWIRHNFGSAGGEGKKFILSEFFYLLKKVPLWIPLSFINNFMKILGYKVGQHYKLFPVKYVPSLSMHKRFWKK
ncbi:glycosyltransferase family 2 protein [Klebsiella pneumoniae]|uniref:glycosyltransferase family 2 protein n=1 Tax=Klebsiella pneumoniae TaxID=573 RepID=UPI00073BD073|nr:glycosyltransferase [Klebsiella pneumoniae]HCM6844984.1 glycosyltransferase family 2 protein [Klebsiella quasipneumoniae]ELA1021442.1 glycosyltransferase family 2 protein [Klebsiella pneumoniae]KSW43313.1 rhamnosyltransferase [Klebsiella pneumoniae]MCL7658735.1 glycosyltransferase [Klebsiella pneumoniae]MCQ0636499.1 glycosyltransferase [Klebsiella pneumoniae]